MAMEMREPSTAESTFPVPRYLGLHDWLERLEPLRWLAEQRDAMSIPVEEYRAELRYWAFSRAARLPSEAVSDDVTATYTDGILTVRLPIDEGRAETRRIPIARD